MTSVEVVGAGAVAQLLCRDLLAKNVLVRLHVPQGARSTQKQAQLDQELRALPWMLGLADDGVCPPDLRLFAGTPEQFWDYQASQHHRSASSPVLLLTSWWDTLSTLMASIQGHVIPVYPRVTVESWGGRLAVLGQLQLELPTDSGTPTTDITSLGALLDACGLAWEIRPMQHRFQALFARTSFAYWYLVNCLEATERGEPPAGRKIIEAQWQQIQPLLNKEPDLMLSLKMMELGMGVIRKGKPESNDAAWILDVLLTQKRGKITYFLQRQQRLFPC